MLTAPLVRRHRLHRAARTRSCGSAPCRTSSSVTVAKHPLRTDTDPTTDPSDANRTSCLPSLLAHQFLHRDTKSDRKLSRAPTRDVADTGHPLADCGPRNVERPDDLRLSQRIVLGNRSSKRSRIFSVRIGHRRQVSTSVRRIFCTPNDFPSFPPKTRKNPRSVVEAGVLSERKLILPQVRHDLGSESNDRQDRLRLAPPLDGPRPPTPRAASTPTPLRSP
jgi:hypothetical protein